MLGGRWHGVPVKQPLVSRLPPLEYSPAQSATTHPLSFPSTVSSLAALTLSSRPQSRVFLRPRHGGPICRTTHHPPPSMSQRYEAVATHDDGDHVEGPYTPHPIPDSPPPSFRSRASSPLSRHDPLRSDADRELADTFDSPSDDEGSDDDHDADTNDRQRLITSTSPTGDHVTNTPMSPALPVERRVTQLPVFAPRSGQTYGSGGANDGVFANLSAKPTRGEDLDEKPPVSADISFLRNEPRC
jgi:hypothetical protein